MNDNDNLIELMYMNPATGSVATRDDWDYAEDGKIVNAVDLGEVVEVHLDDGCWVEVGK